MKHEWHLKRNCSMSPRQVARAYGALCLLVLTIGLAFALHGIWMVFGFAVLEVAALAVALLHYARHAGDREHISLSEHCLLVERVDGAQVRQIRLDPYWTRIAPPDRRRTLIALESRGVRVEVGAFVSEEIRGQVAQELKRELRSSSGLL